MIKIEREDNGKNGQFLIYSDDQFAGELTYTWAGPDMFIIDHTGVRDAFKGKGLAKILVVKAVEFAREQGVKIFPLCPFVKVEFDKNEEFTDVLFQR